MATEVSLLVLSWMIQEPYYTNCRKKQWELVHAIIHDKWGSTINEAANHSGS